MARVHNNVISGILGVGGKDSRNRQIANSRLFKECHPAWGQQNGDIGNAFVSDKASFPSLRVDAIKLEDRVGVFAFHDWHSGFPIDGGTGA